jgi:biopolymer transport protein ExbB/TolQ
MRTVSRSSASVVSDTETHDRDSTLMTPAEKTAAVAKVRYLEQELFDQEGHIRRGITRAAAENTVEIVNGLRQRLGWLEIDLEGRWRWPERAGSRRAGRADEQ